MTATDQLPDWFTRPQLAEYLQISVATLARWSMEPGKGPTPTKLGFAVRYKREHVLEWLESQKASA